MAYFGGTGFEWDPQSNVELQQFFSNSHVGQGQAGGNVNVGGTEMHGDNHMDILQFGQAIHDWGVAKSDFWEHHLFMLDKAGIAADVTLLVWRARSVTTERCKMEITATTPLANYKLKITIGAQVDTSIALTNLTKYVLHIHYEQTTGTLTVKIYLESDGSLVDTLAASTGGDHGSVDNVEYGHATAKGEAAWHYRYDDIWWNDTAGTIHNAEPNVDLEYFDHALNGNQYVNGQGTHDAWTGTPEATAKWQNWDERPSDIETSYNYTTVTGDKQTSALVNMDYPAGTIYAVNIQPHAAWNSAGTARKHNVLMRDGASEAEATALRTIGAMQFYPNLGFGTRPGGGAWTQAALDSLEVGARSVTLDAGQQYRVSTLNVEVAANVAPTAPPPPAGARRRLGMVV